MTTAKRLDSFFWGGVLILAGLAFTGEAMGVLPQIGNANAWSWILLSAGLLSLVLNLISYSNEALEKPSGWDWFWGGLFFIIGLGGFTSVDISWPLIIIFIGAGMLLKAIVKRD